MQIDEFYFLNVKRNQSRDVTSAWYVHRNKLRAEIQSACLAFLDPNTFFSEYLPRRIVLILQGDPKSSSGFERRHYGWTVDERRLTLPLHKRGDYQVLDSERSY